MQRKEFEKKHKARDASKKKIGIALSRFNTDITTSMLGGAREILRAWRVQDKNIFLAETYGSFELPYACELLIARKKVDALIAIGCIVKGETSHDKYLAQSVMHGLMEVSLKHHIPIGLAILTTNTLAQAKARSRGKSNHGEKAAIAALEAALL